MTWLAGCHRALPGIFQETEWVVNLSWTIRLVSPSLLVFHGISFEPHLPSHGLLLKKEEGSVTFSVFLREENGQKTMEKQKKVGSSLPFSAAGLGMKIVLAETPAEGNHFFSFHAVDLTQFSTSLSCNNHRNEQQL